MSMMFTWEKAVAVANREAERRGRKMYVLGWKNRTTGEWRYAAFGAPRNPRGQVRAARMV